jgi:hypothetical protein
MTKYLLILFILLAGCRGKKVLRGLPPGAVVACYGDDLLTCIGGGHSYMCIRSYNGDDADGRDHIYECAENPTGPPRAEVAP